MPIDTTHLDADSDNIMLARPALLAAAQAVNALQATGASALIPHTPAGTGAAPTDVQSKLRESVSVLDFYANGVSGAKVDPTGVLRSDQGVQAASDYAAANGLTLQIIGTPLIEATVNVPDRVKWVFAGASANSNVGSTSKSYLKKAASLNGLALYVTGGGAVFEGGGVVGVAGNGGDNVQIAANSFSWLGAPVFHGAGRDGIRLGVDAGIVDSNSIYLEAPLASGNGRHGIKIHDSAATNVNACLISHPNCIYNTGDGLHLENTGLGTTVLCPTLQANTGYGLYLGALAYRNAIVGGDIEANTAGNVFESIKFGNRFVEVTIDGVVTNTSYKTSSFTPAIYGGTSAGTGTYTAQKGHYTFIGGAINFAFELSWTAHTGTGQMVIDLPNLVPLQTISYISNVATYIPVAVVSSGVTLPAGAQMSGLSFNTTTPPRVQLYTSNAGVLAPQSIADSGTLYVSGTIPLINL